MDTTPTDARARYELAIVLGKLEEQEEANRQMELVLKSGDAELSAAAKAFLGKKKLSVSVAGGLQYDSNVILEQDNPITPNEKKADWRAVLALNAVDSLLSTDKVNAEAGYQFYQSLHEELTDFNVQQHLGRLAGRYVLSNTARLDLEYAFSYSFVGGDHYSTIHRLAPALSFNLTPDSLTVLHASHEARRYFDSAVFTELTGKSGSDASAGASHTLMLGKAAAVAFDYTYDKDSAADDAWAYVGNKGTISALGEQGQYRFYLTASYYDRKYEGLIPGAPEERHDGTQEYSAGLTRKINTDLSITLGDSFTINDSNLELFRYKRNIIGLTAELAL